MTVNQYATQIKLGDTWSEPIAHPSETIAFATFDQIKQQGTVTAVAVLSRPSADKAWQVCANARQQFGYRN